MITLLRSLFKYRVVYTGILISNEQIQKLLPEDSKFTTLALKENSTMYCFKTPRDLETFEQYATTTYKTEIRGLNI